MTQEQLLAIRDNFFQELLLASQNKPSSLSFINHQLAPTPLVAEEEVFQVMGIGGSVFKKALVKKHGGSLLILETGEIAQPQFTTEESLFTFIASQLDPQVRILALNFAYPLSPIQTNGILDGTLIRGSKENTFNGLVGKKVGESLSSYFQAQFQRDVRVTTANDTICLLLSGLLQKSPLELAAGIVGTGMNFAVFSDERTAVNLEAGRFNKFESSNAGKKIDEESLNHGEALFEKEISGAYLFKKYNLLAAEKGLASRVRSTLELDEKAHEWSTAESLLAREILSESAQMIGAAVSAICLYSKHPITFIMEGSLYWKGYAYKETVTNTALSLSPEFQPNFISVADSIFLGAAHLVT